MDLNSWADAISFFSEAFPLGVIGSFLEDKFNVLPDYYTFKHNYLFFATDSEVLLKLLCAINEKRRVELDFINKNGRRSRKTVLPLKVFMSTQSGRSYVAVFNFKKKRINFQRIDLINGVKSLLMEPEYDIYAKEFQDLREHLWGVSVNSEKCTHSVEMIVRVGPGEGYIIQRLEREKRCGKVEQIEKWLWRFYAEVYDAREMLPWTRTFTGRIVSFKCSHKETEECFHKDLEELARLYGGEEDAV